MITQPTGRDTPPFPEIDVLWITAGLAVMATRFP